MTWHRTGQTVGGAAVCISTSLRERNKKIITKRATQEAQWCFCSCVSFYWNFIYFFLPQFLTLSNTPKPVESDISDSKICCTNLNTSSVGILLSNPYFASHWEMFTFVFLYFGVQKLNPILESWFKMCNFAAWDSSQELHHFSWVETALITCS